ncbi:hypothetical protein ACHAXN_001404 [Cyclotella atomus]
MGAAVGEIVPSQYPLRVQPILALSDSGENLAGGNEDSNLVASFIGGGSVVFLGASVADLLERTESRRCSG